jgi:hypothetical protein
MNGWQGRIEKIDKMMTRPQRYALYRQPVPVLRSDDSHAINSVMLKMLLTTLDLGRLT